MATRTIQRGLSALFVGVLAVPLYLDQSGFVDDVYLDGVEARSASPEWSWAAWFDGSFQRQFETRHARTLALRNRLVRTENQLNLDLFGVVVPNLIRGPRDQLFETTYHPRRDWFESDIEQMRERVRDLSKLEAALAARGVTIAVMISPSKVRLYPEELPADLRALAARPAPTNYTVVRPLLDEHHIPTLDFKRFFADRKRTSPVRFFARGGTHWNYYAAALAADELVTVLARLSGEEYPSIGITGHEFGIADGSDRDIAGLTNVWDPERFIDRVPQPAFAGPPAADGPRKRLLIVGGSFVWTIGEILSTRRVCSKLDVYYYNSRCRSYAVDTPEQKVAVSRRLDKGRVDLAAELLAYDAIVIETNEILLHRLGFGFIEEACAAFGIGASAAPLK